MPWLLNEDFALKKKLQGLTVFDGNAPNGRPVPVRFRLPETEVADLTFPIIIIKHNGWYPANDREHRGKIMLPYAPEDLPTWWDDSVKPAPSFNPADSPYKSFFPIPYNLDYEISVYARIMHEHTIPLVSALAAYDRLHAKFAFLDIPQDGTKRTLQLLGGPSLDEGKDENGKRIFIVKYIIRVFSELVPEIAQSVLVNIVNLDLSVYSDTSDLTGTSFDESHALISTGASMSWNVS